MTLPIHGIVLALILTAAAAVPSDAARPEDAASARAFARVMERALSRAEADLLSSKDFWVDHSTWADPWVVSSENFTVRTTASRHVADKIAKDLEFMLTQFQALLGTTAAPNPRIEIWILPTLGDYNAAGQSADEHSTFYASFVDAASAGQPVTTYDSNNLTELGIWITHSALHRYIASAFGRPLPLWVSEGLAGYFSLYWDWTWGAARLARAQSTSRYVPLRNLVNVQMSNMSDDHVIELGMLFKYLLHHREDTRLAGAGEEESDTSFATFLRDVVRGGDGRDTGFVQQILRGDLDALEADFRAFEF